MTIAPLESSTEYYGYVRIEAAEMYAQECAAAAVKDDRSSRAPNESMASMNLRDWFAAHALAGLSSELEFSASGGVSQAYLVADEMMKARAL